jgi:hypothetical protein
MPANRARRYLRSLFFSQTENDNQLQSTQQALGVQAGLGWYLPQRSGERRQEHRSILPLEPTSIILATYLMDKADSANAGEKENPRPPIGEPATKETISRIGASRTPPGR